jgi:hypothetical protein
MVGFAASGSGIDVIPVQKEELLNRLKENREKHQEEWTESFKGYQKEWIKQAKKVKADAEKAHAKAMKRMQKAIDAAQRAVEKGGLAKFPEKVPGVGASRNLPEAPRCYTKDYDVALDLFGMFVPMEKDRPGVIDLSPSDFAHYCRDDWGWKGEHAASVANYGANLVACSMTGPTGPVGATGVTGPVGPYDLAVDWDDEDDEDDDE